MIAVNMHEAKVAEIRRRVPRRKVRDLRPETRFRVALAPGYQPTEPLADDEGPHDPR